MQVAIVTGASSGIGFGTAVKLAEMGMAVLGTGRDAAKLEKLAKAINAPERVATLAVDLTADEAPQRVVELALSRWGRIDFLINNAGVGSPKPLHETDDQHAGLLPGTDVACAVSPCARCSAAHEARLGDHQCDVDLCRYRWPAGWGVFRSQRRIDRADHAHCLSVRRCGHPLQRCRSGSDRDTHDRGAPGRSDVQANQCRNDAAHSVWARLTISPARSPSCVRRAAASSMARPSWSMAAGVRRSTCPSLP